MPLRHSIIAGGLVASTAAAPPVLAAGRGPARSELRIATYNLSLNRAVAGAG